MGLLITLQAGGPQDPPPPTMVMSKGNSIKVKANGNGTESKPKMNKGSPGSKEDIKPNGSGYAIDFIKLLTQLDTT